MSNVKIRATPPTATPASTQRWRQYLAEFRTEVAVAFDQLRFYFYAVLLLVLLLVGYFWQRILITVPAGNHAVLFDRFRGGTRTDKVFDEGFHLCLPWNTLIPYETRLQQQKEIFKVLSEEGLEMTIGLAIRYTPVVHNLGYLHRDVGPEYFNRLIKPEIEGHLRHTVGNRPAHDVFASVREVLQEISRVPTLGRVAAGSGSVQNATNEPYVRLEEILLVDVTLPQSLTDSINGKLSQEQASLEYTYRIRREEKESERKRVEAAGIRDYNLIVGKVSPDTLRWRSIEATIEMAKSPNTKVVFLSSNQQGVPLMLNFTEQTASSAVTHPEPPLVSAPPPPAQRVTPAKQPAPASPPELKPVATPKTTSQRSTDSQSPTVAEELAKLEADLLLVKQAAATIKSNLPERSEPAEERRAADHRRVESQNLPLAEPGPWRPGRF